ncbi:hypothetical protein QA596_04175 [Balneolales bacterium ANBcel1]|nr:hypothetical protein [Balneolales bacterium ANBcel1]
MTTRKRLLYPGASMNGISGAFLILFIAALLPATAIATAGATSGDPESFEGSMHLVTYTVNGGEREEVARVRFTMNPDYLLIERTGGRSLEILGGVRARGILVRQKTDTIVFLTADEKAVTMNKQELRQMITMVESLRGGNAESGNEVPEMVIEDSGETGSVQGYSARKWIASTPGLASRWHIWIADDLSVPWGMLSESWLTRHAFLAGFPAEEWLDEGKLPLRAEHFQGSNPELVEVLEFENIIRQPVREIEFRTPDHYQSITFQQLLFDRMRNR